MVQAVYYVLCGLGWVVAAAVCFLLWKLIGRLRTQTERDRRPIVLLLILVSAVVGANYVLAYPVALSQLPAAGYGAFLDLFVPAEWLYDHTPLRGVIHAVGETLGVGGALEEYSQLRQREHYWGTTLPLLYAAGWLLFGGAAVAGVVWLMMRIERLVHRGRHV